MAFFSEAACVIRSLLSGRGESVLPLVDCTVFFLVKLSKFVPDRIRS